MNVNFIYSFFKNVYLEFNKPRDLKIRKEDNKYIIEYHKFSKEELNKRVPPILFSLFCFIVIPLANIERVIFGFLSESSDLKFSEIILGLAILSYLFGMFYVAYRLTTHAVFGKISLIISGNNIQINKNIFGIKKIDELIIPRQEIKEVKIIKNFLFRNPILYLFYSKGNLSLMESRPFKDMNLIKELLDNYISEKDSNSPANSPK